MTTTDYPALATAEHHLLSETRPDVTAPSTVTSLVGQTFGLMLRRVNPVIEHFLGDLYHDAMWMHEHIEHALTEGEYLLGEPCPTRFVWGFTNSHTSIGHSTVGDTSQVMTFNDHVYRIIIEPRLTEWSVTWVARFEALKGGV